MKHVAMHYVRLELADQGPETENSPDIRHASTHVQGMHRNALPLEVSDIDLRIHQASDRDQPVSRFQFNRKASRLRLGASESKRRYHD